MVTPGPPSPFTAAEVILLPGHALYRVHKNIRGAAEFNPGFGAPTRFAFFGNPSVPVLYAADTENAAICETLLHSIPAAGGNLLPSNYESTVASKLVSTRPIRLAALLGTGLRRLGVEASDVTATEADRYADTVRWAEAAHDAGFEGLAYMSRRCNSDRAYVFFGDCVDVSDFDVSGDYGRAFVLGTHRDWLIEFCAPLHVNVLII